MIVIPTLCFPLGSANARSLHSVLKLLGRDDKHDDNPVNAPENLIVPIRNLRFTWRA